MDNNFEIEKSLSILRTVWLEGKELRTWFAADGINKCCRELFSADVLGWVERTKMILRNVFYNEKFLENYNLSLRSAYDDRGEYIDEAKAISIANDYIRTLGQLLKKGFVKDPYSGIDNSASKVCFVAMWFDATMEDYFSNGMKPAVEGLGFDCVRIDKLEHNERIDNKIFELIRKSRFVVADFTGDRDGVYYEAGFAAGQGVPVIHTCRSDWFDRRHFDIGTINTIKYADARELNSLLAIRIKDTIGRYVPTVVDSLESDGMPF